MKERRKDTVQRINKGWQNQPEFDEEISYLNISSLRFLKHKYKKEIRDFENHFDIENPDFQMQYKRLLQRKKMLDKEYEFKKNADSSSPEEQWFDAEKGIVFDENYKEKYAVAYTEDEDDITYVTLNAKASSECRGDDDETDYEMYEPIDRKEKYAQWDYVKLIEED